VAKISKKERASAMPIISQKNREEFKESLLKGPTPMSSTKADLEKAISTPNIKARKSLKDLTPISKDKL